MSGAIPSSPEEFAKLMEAESAGTFTDQCYLLDYVDVLAAHNRCLGTKYKYFTPVTVNYGSGPFEVISKLTSRDGLQELVNIKPADMALLQPRVRLFKCVYESMDDTQPELREFVFPEHIDTNSLAQITSPEHKRQRSGGIGLKEFSWKFAGTNPAEADKLIEVQMKIACQTALDWFGEHYDGMTGIFNHTAYEASDRPSFMDLILHPPTSEQIDEANRMGEYISKFYRIKADVGWSLPQNNKFPTLGSKESEDLRGKLASMKLSMFLNLVKHEFSVKENGGFEVTIDYVGSLETVFDSKSTDILHAAKLWTDPRYAAPGSGRVYTTSQWNNLQDQYDQEFIMKRSRNVIKDLEEIEECASILGYGEEAQGISARLAEEQEVKDEALGEWKRVTAFSRHKIYQEFLKALVATDSIRALPKLNKSRIAQWENSTISSNRQGGYQGGRPPLRTDLIQQVSDVRKFGRAINKIATAEKDGNAERAASLADNYISKAKEKASSSDARRIHYLYFGDILEIACKSLDPKHNKNAGKLAVLTGPVSIKHPRDGAIIDFNLADLPIPLELFLAFFMETVIKPMRDAVPLRVFVKELLEKLVRPSLKPSECFPGNKEGRSIEIGQSCFTISNTTYNTLTGFDPFLNDGIVNVSQIDDSGIEPVEDNEDGWEILFLYLTSYSASELIGNPIEDMSKGIYHYSIGQSTGLLRKMDFKRTDIPGLREARQADNRTMGQISDTYNCNVTLVGNNIYIPGMMVFLNPPYGFGPSTTKGSLAETLGIGGYYNVIKVESVISRGGAYTTDLECVRSHSGAIEESNEERCEKILSSDKARSYDADLNSLESNEHMLEDSFREQTAIFDQMSHGEWNNISDPPPPREMPDSGCTTKGPDYAAEHAEDGGWWTDYI